MVEQFVSADSMSCLFNEDCFAESYPEPFRMQGTVSFRVVYQEYIQYILTLPHNTSVKLMTDLRILRRLASARSPMLYQHFLGDMAFAISKEVWYAEKYKKEASIILPSSSDKYAQGVSDVLNVFAAVSALTRPLASIMGASGYDGLSPKIVHNVELWRVAVYLYSLSLSRDLLVELNLVYDL